MLRSRLHSNGARWAIWLVIGSCFHAITTSDASAQRLLDRLRSRFQPPPSVAPRTPYQTPNAMNRARPNTALRGATPGRTLATPVPRPGLEPPSNELQSPESIGSEDIQFGLEVTPRVVGSYQGLWVDGISADSRADEAGVRPGDLIVSIEGVRTRDLNEAAMALRDLDSADQSVLMQLFRGGRLYQGRVPILNGDRVAAKPALPNPATAGSSTTGSSSTGSSSTGSSSTGPTLAKPRASLGIEVRNATPQRGVLVASVPSGTAGAAAGLQEGDRIVSAAGRLVRDTDDLLREMAVLLPGDQSTFGLIRGETMLEREVEMGTSGGTLPKSATVEANSVSADDSSTQELLNNSNATSGLLSGVGSVFGKMLGGNQDANASTLPPQKPAPSSDGVLPMPAAKAVDASPENSFVDDPLALPADTVAGAETLPMPVITKKLEPKTAAQKVAELEAEIKRLKSQLRDQ